MPVEVRQLRFQWPGESPEGMKKRRDDSWLRWSLERYPAQEWEIAALPPTSRLCRHVHPAECDACNFGPYDHTDGWAYPTKVCLKDLARLGLWTPAKEQAPAEEPAPAQEQTPAKR